MLGAAAHNIFRDWLTYIVALSGVALTWGTIYIRVISPRARDHVKHQAERAELERQNELLRSTRWQVIDGIPERPGMTPAVPPLAVRLRALEDWRDQFE